MTKFAIALVAAMSCTLAAADTVAGPAEARQLTDQVMAKVVTGDTESALRLMKPYLTIPDSEFESMIEQMKLQTPVMARRFGSTIGSEFIREDRVGANLFRIIQLQRFEKHPMRWAFYFYRGKDGWILNTFRTDDGVMGFFQP